MHVQSNPSLAGRAGMSALAQRQQCMSLNYRHYCQQERQLGEPPGQPTWMKLLKKKIHKNSKVNLSKTVALSDRWLRVPFPCA